MTLPRVLFALLACSAPAFAESNVPAPPVAAPLSPGQFDAVFAKESPKNAPAASDETFVRRLTLDIVGRNPSPDEIRTFLTDASPDKRAKLVERLLASPEFGTNWGAYWSDTVKFRVAPPELTFLTYDTFRAWFAKRLNNNDGWDAVVRDLITATGKVQDNPAAVFVAYHEGDAEKLAAETSRIFLGLQIQCAQCHDHKFDHWQRKQFHSLAAFYARVGAKLTQNNPGPTEVKDKGKGEHSMPNAADPRKKGTVMDPVFLTGPSLPPNANDLERRTFLAKHLTAPENPWFARAYVNRVWAKLMGRGFYDPVDNMADYQDHRLSKTHEALAGHFTATGFDVKDLFRLVATSEAYARADTAPVRLRGDQVFESLLRATGIPIVTPPAMKPTGAVRFPPPPKSTRDVIVGKFSFDPSLCPEEVTWNMGQAMMLMNNREIQAQVSADPKSGTALARLLAREADDGVAAAKLYQSVLARAPTERESALVLEHVANVGTRGPAFEDVLWALINSAEFHVRK